MLAKILSIDQSTALGLLEALWHVTAEDAPRGNIGRLSNTAIAMQMYTTIDPERLISALIESHHLDEDKHHRLLVHDWDQYADYTIKRKLLRNKESFFTANGDVTPMSDNGAQRRTVARNGSPLSSHDSTKSRHDATPEPDALPALQARGRKKSKSMSAGADHTPVDLTEYWSAYNENCGALAKIRDLTTTRKRMLIARTKNGLTLETFTAAVRKAAATPHCIGHNDAGWSVTFDWLIRDETNIAKILEGNYDDKKIKTAKQSRMSTSTAPSYKDLAHG